jgi:hypothetical protein
VKEVLPQGSVDAVVEVLAGRCSGGDGIPFEECEPAGAPVKLAKAK